MQHVHGRIFDDPTLPSVTPSLRNAIYRAMATTLATLHSVIPKEIGLERYGAPSKYNSRQVARWQKQYLKSVGPGVAPMEEMMRLGNILSSRIPDSDTDCSVTRICHGDYRIDNLVFSLEAGHEDTVLAVLDWELSTLGDPIADLAYCCLPYHLSPGGLPTMFALPHTLPEGVPTEDEFIDIYCTCRGVPPPSSKDWPFYVSLAIFRLASILAGVGARAKQGNASSKVAGKMGAHTVVKGLAQTALRIVEQGGGSPFQGVSSTSSLSPTGLGPSPKVQPILDKLKQFMDDKIYPAESVLNAHAVSDARWTIHPLQETLKTEAKAQGLWNLWLPSDMAESLGRLLLTDKMSSPLGEEKGKDAALLLGPGLSNVEYAHCAEVMGRCVWASEVFNCSAPDTGNMEVLARYGTDEQRRRWLVPLLRGEIRSCFAMTEPAVASSDATNITSTIQKVYTEAQKIHSKGPNDNAHNAYYVVEGRKWWISGATDPRCKVAIFMGKTDSSAPVHRQQSMILVDMGAPGVTVVRPLPVFGFDDAPHGHAEVDFQGVAVPAENLILGEGRGFEIAQGRLGPGRLHHCMRLIGMGERGLELMTSRALQRSAFGKTLAEHQAVRLDIARSRMELDAARLTVLEAALALDELGNKAARGKIAAAKAMTPSVILKILDRAIQTYGGAGVSNATPLAAMWAGARTLRLADGPDVVHLETIAKLELSKARRARL